MDVYLGIEIGGTKLQIYAAALDGQIRERRKLTVEPAKGAPRIRAQIQDELKELSTVHRIKGIGVGFGGPVDWKLGRICKSHHVSGWSDFDLASCLQPLVGCHVKVD